VIQRNKIVGKGEDDKRGRERGEEEQMGRKTREKEIR
jgi:hypothetical protein